MKVFGGKGITQVMTTLFDGRRVHALAVERDGASVKVAARASIAMGKDVHRASAEELTKVLGDLIEQLDFRGSHVAAALTLDYCYFLRTAVPDLSPEDTESFLGLQAEKEFPFSLAELALADRRTEEGTIAEVVGARRVTVENLRGAFASLKLTVLSLGLEVSGVPAEIATWRSTTLLLIARQGRVDVAVFQGDATWGLRAIEAPSGVAGAASRKFLSRELRITLSQLGADTRKELRDVFLIGDPADLGEGGAEAVDDFARDLGLRMRRDTQRDELLEEIGARALAGKRIAFDFIPEKKDRFAQAKAFAATPLGKKTIVGVGGALGVLLVALIGQWAWLASLESRWAKIAPDVTVVEQVQGDVRRYRGWFDPTIPTLAMFTNVVAAFPDRGDVTLNELEIELGSFSTLTGVATSQDAVNRVLEALRGNPGLANATLGRLEGRDPVSFSMTVERLNGGSASE